VTFALLALHLAAQAAAPGCPAALQEASALPDSDLAVGAATVVERLAARGAGGPTAALGAEALRGASSPGADRARAGVRFRAALARHCALAGQPPLPAAGPAERALAAEILDRPEFRRARLDPDALRRRLRALWDSLLSLLETGQAQRYAAFSRTVFLGAVAAAALLAVLALRRPLRARRAPSPESPAFGAGPPDARLSAAEAAAAAGQAGLAIRLAFLAALGALEREGLVPPGRTLTSLELLEHVDRSAPARTGALAALTRAFDEVFYGGRAAGAAQADAALRAARALGAGGTS
jgi:hypothetical protein